MHIACMFVIISMHISDNTKKGKSYGHNYNYISDIMMHIVNRTIKRSPRDAIRIRIYMVAKAKIRQKNVKSENKPKKYTRILKMVIMKSLG